MKITSVKAFHPVSPDAPNDWRSWLGQIAVTVETDDGLTGYGVGGGGPAGVQVVNTVLRSLLVGEGAVDVEALWEQMYRGTLPYGRKGIAIMAISGVDLALWDLRAKREESSVVEVLGGKAGAVQMYRTLFPGEWGEAAVEYARDYSALKLHVWKMDAKGSSDGVIDLVRFVRNAVGGDVTLMADAFMNWDVETTLRVAEAVEDCDLAWLEEPLPPDDLDGYARLRDECPIPIAGGEHEYTASSFRTLIDDRLHAVLQPDVCWCGGMTELVKIYGMAKEAGLRVVPHRGAEVWALHAIAALDPNPLAESGRPWMTWVKSGVEIANGTAQLSESVGFGATFDEV